MFLNDWKVSPMPFLPLCNKSPAGVKNLSSKNLLIFLLGINFSPAATFGNGLPVLFANSAAVSKSNSLLPRPIFTLANCFTLVLVLPTLVLRRSNCLITLAPTPVDFPFILGIFGTFFKNFLPKKPVPAETAAVITATFTNLVKTFWNCFKVFNPLSPKNLRAALSIALTAEYPMFIAFVKLTNTKDTTPATPLKIFAANLNVLALFLMNAKTPPVSKLVIDVKIPPESSSGFGFLLTPR